MCAAAKLDRPAHAIAACLSHRDNTHLIAILLAEKCPRTGRCCVVYSHQFRHNGRVLQNNAIRNVFDLRDIAIIDRLRMRKVEAQTIRRNQGSFLSDVIAEYLTQRFVEKVRTRMIAAYVATSRVIDFKQKRKALLQGSLLHLAKMHDQLT